MMSGKDLASMLARDAEGVARMLLPNGKRMGAEWCVGSVDGGEGKSLKVHLTGKKAGLWKDFSGGPDESGDLIDLWSQTRGLDMRATFAEVREHLGVREHRVENKPAKTYTRPTKDRVQRLPPQMVEWLSVVRRISEKTIDEYKLAARDGWLMFPYLRDGELVAAKYRRVPAKEFRVDKDCEPCLFGWQAMTGRERSVTLVEGELDTLALAEYGIRSLSVPFGGGTGEKQGKWIECEFDRLSQFDTIYLALDDDAVGQEAASEIALRLGRERCRVVQLPRKDANQCLIDGVGEDSMREAFAKARTLDPEQLRQAADYEDELVAAFKMRPGEERGIRLPWAKAKNRVVLREGEVSIWLGVNGHGKSQGMGQITLGALVRDFRCCVASMEFKPRGWLQRMTRQATALQQPAEMYVRNVSRWYRDKLWVFDATGTAKADQILEVFAYAARRYGVFFFLIDNLAKCGFAEDDYNGQKGFVDRLSDFAKEYAVHVALVHHMRKPANEDQPGGKLDAKGSGGITDMADTVAVWWRNKPKERHINACKNSGQDPDPKKAEESDAKLIFDKQRNGEEEPGFLLWFDQESLQFLEWADARPHRFVENRPVDQQAEAA